MMIGFTHSQLPAYWNSPSRLFWRNLIGDRSTLILYDLIGVSLVIMGSLLFQ